MDAATFERLPDIHSQIRCPVCRLNHNWSTREAWLGNPAPSVPRLAWLFIKIKVRRTIREGRGEMSDEDARKLWKERADKPFEPLLTSSGKGIDTDAALRMAHAFEYIAAQLVRLIGSASSSSTSRKA